MLVYFHYTLFILNLQFSVLVKIYHQENVTSNTEETLTLIRKSLRSATQEVEGTHFDQNIPHIFVTFGASGDLAKKKIYPTLWWLFRDNLLPSNTIFYGYARSKITVDKIRESCEKFMQVKPGQEQRYEDFWKKNHYFSGSYDTRKDFELLHQELLGHEKTNGAANRLFYLALPPSVFENVTVHIRNTSMAPR
ncbi:glucose-6-phosphate 1-dehydrogenase isoform X1 [Diaphorina citri]|uniref:Glucose-6-phosphate 1-dehydrogenase n=1 Tax=Diaphorina citri TaxID=121845 RepID=A0A1S3CWZ0_DIACI|nr:glucose-6-phosphate 1-dehydrogenase isoform X1 [Diaphorina citri]